MGMRFLSLLVATVFLAISSARAESTLLIEEMTWPEVAAAIKAGKQTAIIYAGSTEQNGPHMVLGKHNFVARHLAVMIARELGDALVYPVLPFAPTGDLALRSGHMRFPGSVSLREDVFGEVIRDMVLSAVDAGFRDILIMGDHGEGQNRLAAVARAIDQITRPSGIRVFYVDAVYTQSVGEHAGREDTSMLMAVDSQRHWVRKDRLGQADAANGVDADPKGASVAEGRRLLDVRVRAAVRQIRELMAGTS